MIILVTAGKGGVGKTTTSLAIAGHLAQHGATLVDMDEQAHCELALGLDRNARADVYDWLINDRHAEECVTPARHHGLRLIAGSPYVKTLQSRMGPRGYSLLMDKFQTIDTPFVVVDSAASGWSRESLMTFADIIVVPVTMDYFALDGMLSTISLWDRLRDRSDSAQRIIVLPTLYHRARRFDVDIHHSISRYTYPPGVLFAPQPVPHRTLVARLMASGKTIWESTRAELTLPQRAYRELCTMITDYWQTMPGQWPL